MDPYRKPGEVNQQDTLSVGPIEFSGPDTGFHGPAYRADRQLIIDGRPWHHPVGVWDGQRNGKPAVGVSVATVLTRPMWEAYKRAIDELFDAFDEYRSQK